MPQKRGALTTRDVEDWILALYGEGKKVLDIAETTDVSTSSIYAILRRRGVSTRQVRTSISPEKSRTLASRYEAGEEPKIIAEDEDVSPSAVYAAIRREGTRIRPRGASHQKYEIDQRFFQSIDTEEKAYWLGFLTADGYVGDTISLALAEEDTDHVRRFRNAIGSTHPVQTIPARETRLNATHVIKSKPQTRLLFRCKAMADDLASLGLGRDKSYTATPAILPESLERHYWRGVFDGDGSLILMKNGYWNMELLGTEELIQGFVDFVRHRVDLPINDPSRAKRTKSAWRWRSQGIARPQAVARLLYEDCSVALPRKMEKARELLEEQPQRIRRL